MKRIRGFTLIETLVAISILLLMMPFAFELSQSLARRTAFVLKDSTVRERSAALRKVWRSALHNARDQRWVMQGDALSAGPMELAIAEDALELRSGTERRTYSMPDGVRMAISLETLPGGIQLAVLDMAWPSGAHADHALRIVAAQGASHD